MALTIDTRTATEYGVVRTFGQADFQFNNFGNSNTSSQSFPGFTANALNTPGGGYVAVEYLFIQFAGFTFGKSSSAYSTPWNGFPGNINSSLLGGNNTDTGVNNIQYTAQFGNGVSASIGLDDPTVWNRTAVYNLSSTSAIGANGTGSNAYAGTHMPDIVGNIRVDQAWGLFQFGRPPHMKSAARIHPRRQRCSDRAFRNQRPPRDEDRLLGDGGAQHQEHPDWRRRRHQVRRLLCQGCDQERDRHQWQLAELCDVRR